MILHERYWEEKTQQSDIILPREDLANIIGAARESLGRLLKEFKDEKLIAIKKRVITILDFEKIEKLANS